MKRVFHFLFIALASASPLIANPPPTPAPTPAPQQADAQPKAEEEMELPTPTPTTSIPTTNYKRQFTGTLIAIVVIVFLVFFIIWLLRRFTCDRPLHMNHRKHIKVIERRPLSPNTFIYLLQVGDKQFVIAESKFQVHNVATLDWNESTPD